MKTLFSSLRECRLQQTFCKGRKVCYGERIGGLFTELPTQTSAVYWADLLIGISKVQQDMVDYLLSLVDENDE